jgi:cytochrome c oxidase subunit 1
MLPRPVERHKGLWSWITTVDHKRIGTLYGLTAFFWFLVGGIEALVMRWQLAGPERESISPEVFNQLFTMHGTTMIFLVVMPLGAAFFNWLIPLQIGARDVAFPRLNAFSYWTFLFGGLLLNASWVFGGAPNSGWFGYAPLTAEAFNLGDGVTFWILGLQVLGIASLAAAFNFVVTILNMRAPGMTLFKMPLFTWMTLVTSVLLVAAFPVITVALIELQFDRLFGTNYYNPAAGGDPVLWQHMFWLFGHPEVYILILPAMGIVSEILPTMSRKPLFGYPFVIFSGITIAFLGWFVWSHHMFTVGLGTAANTAFAVSTMLIAVPTGVKILNWLATTWRGSLRLNTPMLFALGFIAMFTIGGLSGVTHASPPTDAQQQDTYYIVAHFHYVLFGGALFGIFAGMYYWWPKMTGRLLSETIGKIHFVVILVGFNLTFAPMHWLGLDGMPRRIYTYSKGMGWDSSNLWATVGAFLIALGVLIFMINVLYTMRKGKKAGNDPWDARTLEWSIPSPPPEHNFERIPTVRHLDDFWYQKHPELAHEERGHSSKPRGVPHGAAEDSGRAEGHGSIHLPGLSYYPIILSAGIALAMGGFVSHIAVTAVGGAIAVWGLLGWSFEPASEPASGHGHSDPHASGAKPVSGHQ